MSRKTVGLPAAKSYIYQLNAEVFQKFIAIRKCYIHIKIRIICSDGCWWNSSRSGVEQVRGDSNVFFSLCKKFNKNVAELFQLKSENILVSISIREADIHQDLISMLKL